MFISLVNVGRFKSYERMTPETQKLRMPPLIEGSKDNSRYDSVHNNNLQHYVVYDNSKAYPGYLLTYSLPESLKTPKIHPLYGTRGGGGSYKSLFSPSFK